MSDQELPSKYVKPVEDQGYISPEDPEHPLHGCEVDPKYPPLPLPRKQWFLDFRKCPQNPLIYYDGKLVGKVQKVFYQISATDGELLPKAVLEILNPDFVASLEGTDVTVVLPPSPEVEKQAKDGPTY